MVTEGEGRVGDELRLTNDASKGENGGRVIYLNRQPKAALGAVRCGEAAQSDGPMIGRPCAGPYLLGATDIRRRFQLGDVIHVSAIKISHPDAGMIYDLGKTRRCGRASASSTWQRPNASPLRAPTSTHRDSAT